MATRMGAVPNMRPPAPGVLFTASLFLFTAMLMFLAYIVAQAISFGQTHHCDVSHAATETSWMYVNGVPIAIPEQVMICDKWEPSDD